MLFSVGRYDRAENVKIYMYILIVIPTPRCAKVLIQSDIHACVGVEIKVKIGRYTDAQTHRQGLKYTEIHTIVVKYVKKLALNTAYATFFEVRIREVSHHLDQKNFNC